VRTCLAAQLHRGAVIAIVSMYGLVGQYERERVLDCDGAR